MWDVDRRPETKLLPKVQVRDQGTRQRLNTGGLHHTYIMTPTEENNKIPSCIKNYELWFSWLSITYIFGYPPIDFTRESRTF